MNGPLVVKYFIHNHKRTVLAIFILSIGVIAMSGTEQMVNVLSNEVDRISIIPSSFESDYIDITSEGDHFTTNQMQKLYNAIILSPDVSWHSFYNFFSTIIHQDGKQYRTSIIVANITLFFPSIYRSYHDLMVDINGTSGLFVDDNTGYSLIDYQYELTRDITYELYNYTTNQTESHTEILFRSIPTDEFLGIIADVSKYTYDYFNSLRIRFFDRQSIKNFIQSISNIEGINFSTDNSKIIFIRSSALGLIKIMELLYLMISILSMLSLGVLMKMIIDESEYEIRVMRSMGFTFFQISSIFVNQALLIGLIGAIFGVLFSFIFINLIFSVLAIIGIGTFIPPEVYLSQLTRRMIESLLIALIGSIYPIYSKVR